MNRGPRIVLAGSVNSSKATLLTLLDHEMDVVGVLGLDRARSGGVSGFQDLEPICVKSKVPFKSFRKINDPDVVEMVREWRPDLLFVVGLSQLVHSDLLSLPTHGAIGFHPTRLPEGRGRAAIAWMILGRAPPAATFFKLEDGIDSGPIWAQVPYSISESDYAQDVIEKILPAIRQGLDVALPEIKVRPPEFVPQDHSKATYLGRRYPEDGLIDWRRPAAEIQRLVQATSKPLPGAYTYLGSKKLIIWRSCISPIKDRIGVPGRLLTANGTDGYVVQTGDGMLTLEEIEGVALDELRVGAKLGIDVEAMWRAQFLAKEAGL